MVDLTRTRHIPALDGVRGVAAILVVIYHVRGGAMNYDGRLGDGFLAVDVFFALSGFVLAQAYLGRLRAGLGVGAFMRARLVRLYPLYILGLGFGIAGALADRYWGTAKLSLSAIAGAGLLETFMLPSRPTHDQFFLINPVAWSLCFEVILSFLLAIFWWIRPRTFWVVTGVAGLVLIGSTIFFQTASLGNTWVNAAPGFARALFSFCLGIAIQQWRRNAAPVFGLRTAAAAMLAMAVWLMFPVSAVARPAFDLAFIMLASPVILVIAAGSKLPVTWTKLAGAAGVVSYALYAVHYPAIYPILDCLRPKLDLNNELTLDIVTAAFVAIMSGAAYALSRFYDAPVRQILGRQFGTRQGQSRGRATLSSAISPDGRVGDASGTT